MATIQINGEEHQVPTLPQIGMKREGPGTYESIDGLFSILEYTDFWKVSENRENGKVVECDSFAEAKVIVRMALRNRSL